MQKEKNLYQLDIQTDVEMELRRYSEKLLRDRNKYQRRIYLISSKLELMYRFLEEKGIEYKEIDKKFSLILNKSSLVD